ncbi:MAG TPA: spore coat protein U domain-containing protein, partial [Thermoanaerobaculia bacterium]|nr:spore coat protein U domain-containing protein [Thermoanaerobaculia bacterium]
MKRTINFLAAATLVLAAVPMFAATANAPLAVSATVAQNCTITTSPVAFGAYDTVTGTAVSGTGAVNVACTMGSTG